MITLFSKTVASDCIATGTIINRTTIKYGMDGHSVVFHVELNNERLTPDLVTSVDGYSYDCELITDAVREGWGAMREAILNEQARIKGAARQHSRRWARCTEAAAEAECSDCGRSEPVSLRLGNVALCEECSNQP